MRFGAFYALFMTPKDLIVTQHEPNKTTQEMCLYTKNISRITYL